MSKLQASYKEFCNNKLLEARTELLEKGVYPFDVFLKNYPETLEAARKIEQLEESVSIYKNAVPTLDIFVKQNSSMLLENSSNVAVTTTAMLNYAFICEAIGKCVKEAASLLQEKANKEDSLNKIYGKDGIDLLEFCLKKANSYKLLEEDASQIIIRQLALELSNLSISKLNALCESIPSMKLYVSKNIHDQLAQTILEG